MCKWIKMKLIAAMNGQQASISSSASPPKQIAVASSKKEERKREGGALGLRGGGRWKINDDFRPDFVVLFYSLIIRYTEHLCAPAIKQLNATV